MQHIKYFFHWWKHQCQCILESCTEESSIAPEFQGHCGNDAPNSHTCDFILQNKKGPNQSSYEGGEISHVFSSQELLLFLTVGPSSEYWTSEYSSTWVSWMLCAQFLKHKKQYFFSCIIFSRETVFEFTVFSATCCLGENEQDGGMAAWLLLHIPTYSIMYCLVFHCTELCTTGHNSSQCKYVYLIITIRISFAVHL